MRTQMPLMVIRRVIFPILLYTCKGFDADAAVAYTKSMLGVEGEIVARSF